MRYSLILLLTLGAAVQHYNVGFTAAKLESRQATSQAAAAAAAAAEQLYNNYDEKHDDADDNVNCNQNDYDNAAIGSSKDVGGDDVDDVDGGAAADDDLHSTVTVGTARAVIDNKQVKVSNEVESPAEHLSNNSNSIGISNKHYGIHVPTRLAKPASNGNKLVGGVGGSGQQNGQITRNTLMSQSVPIFQRYNFAASASGQFGTAFGTERVVASSGGGGGGAIDEQLLRLQDYNFLYNAERHTYFQLHTNLTATMYATMLSSSSSSPSKLMRHSSKRNDSSIGTGQGIVDARLLHNVVGNTLNAAFGFNAGRLPGQTGDVFDDLKLETVELYDAASLRQTRYNPFNPTRILIHGWLGNANANVYSALMPAYLQQSSTGRFNIFTVDWGRGAIADYITASYRVKPVGKAVAKFIDFLHKEAGMRFEDLQVIGFSMGAHVAGIAGKHVRTGRLRVIRALDPALPFFRYATSPERLARSDAVYVEVLHTSVGSYGFDRPLGHADFYANWGSQQPGCFWNECSHWRAFQLFAESLNAEGMPFLAQGCADDDWPQLTHNKRCLRATDRQLSMGGDLCDAAQAADLTLRRGVFYFQTNANAPYAIS